MIRQIEGKYELWERGCLRGASTSLAELERLQANLTPIPPGICPNCGNDIYWSTFYEADYCYRCHWMERKSAND